MCYVHCDLRGPPRQDLKLIYLSTRYSWHIIPVVNTFIQACMHTHLVASSFPSQFSVTLLNPCSVCLSICLPAPPAPPSLTVYSLSRSLSLSVCLSVCLSLSLSLTHTHTHLSLIHI